MIDRIIEIANPARLSIRDAQLVIERTQQEQLSLPFTTPVSEIAVLLLAHPQITLSQAVLSRIAEAGGSVVTIDGKFLPASMQLPVQAHFLQTERFAKQMQLSLPNRKRFWQQIVRAKIRAQGELLKELYGSDAGLIAMSARVRSDDVGNLEAQAARRYWPLVFGNQKFRRGSEEPNQNRHLDYGYTVLRAAVARGLCAVGLHPSIGLRHKNRYDAFCLAADVMEPFRPLIDRRVVQWIGDHDPTAPLDPTTKNWIISATTARYLCEREQRSLFDIVLRTANSLAQCITGEAREIEIPSLLEPCAEMLPLKREVRSVNAKIPERAIG
ncbi:MAG: type II CRISPR-associated endonuclease Cas1 [Acidimicrobiaceae bacterium]|nr:type II CRISPR-associated endonuclease Cas1 [Acidimicrobiaceae bacterium]